MSALRRYIDKIKPNFEKGGKFAMFRSTFEGFETFLFVPDKVTKGGVHIRDANDMKRTMIVVVLGCPRSLERNQLVTQLLDWAYTIPVN